MENTNTTQDILSLLDWQDDIFESFLPIQDETQNNLLEKVETLKKEYNLKIDNILNLDILSLEEDIVWVFENTTQTKNQNKFLWGLKFFTRYILTTSIIFWIMLVWFNYSAYIQRAISYFNPELLSQSKASLQESMNTKVWNNTNTWSEDVEETSQVQNEINMMEKNTFHSMSSLLTEENVSTKDFSIDIVPYENRIIIPKIGKNIPMVEAIIRNVKNVKELEDVFMKDLEKWVVRYPWSAKPGTNWNAFIFWHSSNFPWMPGEYKDVFALLDKLEFNDEIIIFYNQKKYVYKIREKKIVKPWDVSVLKRNNDKAEITLMTCWPVWTTANRMLVVWELQ